MDFFAVLLSIAVAHAMFNPQNLIDTKEDGVVVRRIGTPVVKRYFNDSLTGDILGHGKFKDVHVKRDLVEESAYEEIEKRREEGKDLDPVLAERYESWKIEIK